MCWRFTVLGILTLFSTSSVMAVSLRCTRGTTECRLRYVQTNINNEIDFPPKFNRTLARKATEIEFEQSKFPYFPNNIFDVMPNLISIRAEDCGLVALNTSTFGLDSSYNVRGLETLGLQDNLLKTLEAYTFRQTNNLTYLWLSNNRLSHIDALAFYGLSKLEVLTLGANQLIYLDKLVFTPLISLNRLLLHDNQFQVFNLDFFRGNVKLEYLDLANNKLTTLSAKRINNALKTIDLRKNQLGNISTLAKMKSLNVLDLSDNKNINLESDNFPVMPQLYNLNLDGVDLWRQVNNNYEFLKPLCQLDSLSISRNNLTSLNQLPSLPKLHLLYVHENKISELDVNGLKAQFPSLMTINIDNNPWECQVLKNVLQQFREVFSNLNPGYQRGVFGLSVEKMACGTEVVSPSSENEDDMNGQNIDVRFSDDLVCGRPILSSSQYIYGGRKTVKGAWPWLVAIHKQNGDKTEFTCGGSLISNNLVVSAAHCLTDLLASQTLLYIGRYDIHHMSDTDFQQRGAQQLIIHPDFHRKNERFSSDADIGLIMLSQPVIYTDFIKPICLLTADAANQDIVKQKGVVIGWGFDENDEGTAVPYSVQMPVVSTLDCVLEDYSYVAFTSNRTLCVGEKNGKGPCHGDSGSGFVMKIEGKWVLRGIVSAGLPDPVVNSCDLTKYVVLSDAVKFMDWILLYLKI